MGEEPLEEYNLEIGTICAFQWQAMELEMEENLTNSQRIFWQDFLDIEKEE